MTKNKLTKIFKRSCFMCKKKLRTSLGADFNAPTEQATHWFSYGNYGSTLFDDMGGHELQCIICDDCLAKTDNNVAIVDKTGIRYFEQGIQCARYELDAALAKLLKDTSQESIDSVINTYKAYLKATHDEVKHDASIATKEPNWEIWVPGSPMTKQDYPESHPAQNQMLSRILSRLKKDREDPTHVDKLKKEREEQRQSLLKQPIPPKETHEWACYMAELTFGMNGGGWHANDYLNENGEITYTIGGGNEKKYVSADGKTWKEAYDKAKKQWKS